MKAVPRFLRARGDAAAAVQSAPLPEQAADESADGTGPETCGHQSAADSPIALTPPLRRCRRVDALFRRIGVRRFHRYRRRDPKGGPSCGTHRTQPAPGLCGAVVSPARRPRPTPGGRSAEPVPRRGRDEPRIRSRSAIDARTRRRSCPLLLTQVADLHPRLEPVRRAAWQLTRRRASAYRPIGPSPAPCSWAGTPSGRSRSSSTASHREPLGDDAVSQAVPASSEILDGQQTHARGRRTAHPPRPGAARPERAFPLERSSVGETCGRDRPTRSRQLVVRAVEVLEQLVVGGGLLQRIQLGTVPGSPRARRGAASRRSVGRTMAGMRSRPASRQARQRRSPMISS